MTLDFVGIYFKWWDHLKLCSVCASSSSISASTVMPYVEALVSNGYQSPEPICPQGKKILIQYWSSTQ